MVFWIGKFGESQLGTMARPRGGDWLEDEAKRLVGLGVNVVVSALTKPEEIELELQDEGSLFKAAGLVFVSYPIGDRLTPDFNPAYKKLVDQCAAHLEAGQNLVTHCRMGIGRASLLAASIMVKFGSTPEDAFKLISEKRGLIVPDTQEQIEWVAMHSEQLRR